MKTNTAVRLLAAGLLGAALAADSGAAPAAFQAVTVPNLAGYWKLDETAGTSAADSSGNGNTGTHTNGPVISAALPPMPNYACNLRSLTFPYVVGGPYKTVDVPDSPSLSLTGSITVAAWIRTLGAGLDGMGAPVQQGIIEKWDGPLPAHDGYYLRLTPTLSLSWNICPPGAGGPIGITTAPRVVTPNVWTHVAGTYDAATGAMLMYLDNATGLPDPTTGNAPTPPGNGTSILHLGADYGSNQFNGEIDEARVYNRVLTQAEIQILRNGQAPATALMATPGPGQVALTWTQGPGSTATNIYRAAAAGPFSLLATVAGGAYTDVTANSYFYQVTAVSVMESCPTAPVFATPLPTAPRTSEHDNGNQCSCGTVAPPLPPGLLALAGLALLSLLRLRR